MISIKSFDYFLAGSPLATLDELWRLAIHSDVRIRRRVAENPASGPYLLRLLSTDCSPEVRQALTDNPSTPFALLRLLSCDEHPDVRYALAENHNTPTSILKCLEADANPFVAQRAVRTKATNSTVTNLARPGSYDFSPEMVVDCYDSVAARRALRSSSA